MAQHPFTEKLGSVLHLMTDMLPHASEAARLALHEGVADLAAELEKLIGEPADVAGADVAAAGAGDTQTETEGQGPTSATPAVQ